MNNFRTLVKNYFNELNPYKKLFIISDNADWSLDSDAKILNEICKKISIDSHIVKKQPNYRKICVHHTSQFISSEDSFFKRGNRYSIDYYHGKADQHQDFKKTIEGIKRNINFFSRIRVSNSEIYNYLISEGIEKDLLFKIPIGIDTTLFSIPLEVDKKTLRKKYNIPENSFVIGSFQKDGNGWDEGMEPKYIKGPDILLKSLEIIKQNIPNLFVVLTGPARGYVKNGLDKLGIKYYHEFLKNPDDVSIFYKISDAYIVSSREEGGPKSILESMASGVFIVSTKVGQATDLIEEGRNGYLCNIEDYKQIAQNVINIYENRENLGDILEHARKTAEQNNYTSQIEQWGNFFKGYVNF